MWMILFLPVYFVVEFVGDFFELAVGDAGEGFFEVALGAGVAA